MIYDAGKYVREIINDNLYSYVHKEVRKDKSKLFSKRRAAAKRAKFARKKSRK